MKRVSAGKIACGMAVLCVGGGCATTPPPTEQLAAARAMVNQAQPAAGKDAPLELQSAQTKLGRAEDAMRRGDYEIARRNAEQAEVDAKLAWSAAENARAQRAAAEVERGIETLREELDRRNR
jgi:hypothetical protein